MKAKKETKSFVLFFESKMDIINFNNELALKKHNYCNENNVKLSDGEFIKMLIMGSENV